MGNTSNYIIKKCCFSEVVPLRKSKKRFGATGCIPKLGEAETSWVCFAHPLSWALPKLVVWLLVVHLIQLAGTLCSAYFPWFPPSKGPFLRNFFKSTWKCKPGSLGFENRISKWIPWFIIIWPVKYQYLTHITYPYHTPIFAQSRSETCRATDATLCVVIEWVLLKLRSLFCLSIPPRCDQKPTEATSNTKSIWGFWGYLDDSGLDSVWDCMGTSCRSYMII